MGPEVDRLEHDGIVLVRNPDQPGRWSYLADRSSPQTTEDGTPMISLIEAGSVGFLQISCRLDPPAERLEAARSVLSTDGPITLHSAVTRVDRISVATGEASGEPVELGHSTGSGYPPHTAAFQISLSDERLAAARAALEGRPGFIHVIYEIQTDQGEQTVTVDVAQWLTSDEPSPSEETRYPLIPSVSAQESPKC